MTPAGGTVVRQKLGGDRPFGGERRSRQKGARMKDGPTMLLKTKAELLFDIV